MGRSRERHQVIPQRQKGKVLTKSNYLCRMDVVKHHLSGVFSVIIAFLLACIGVVSFFLLMPFSFVFTIIRSIQKEGVYNALFNFFFKIGVGMDQTGNASYEHLLNATLIKNLPSDAYHHFGDEDETISSVLGRNQITRTLSWMGWMVVLLLWVADLRWIKMPDYRKYGHCIMSIGE